MSNPSTNPNRYEPEPVPEAGGVEELRAHIMREHYRIAALLNMLADGQIERSFAPPEKLNDGMIRYADGAVWDPGAGRGIYRYDITSASWVLLG